MRTFISIIVAVGAALGAAVLVQPMAALACAGLIGSNGAVNLGRTTTLAAYSDGVEHYVTAFEFQGGGGEFGTLIPLPAVPTSVERGGAWTLQRLQQETQPPLADALLNDFSAASAREVEVLQQVRIDALDIKVLRGGGADVAVWAEERGFRLSPDAPEVLDFYAQRSPIFLAAVFDGEAAAARGQQLGDGTPVHITMPTDNPWVPLRILSLGKQPEDQVAADVFLLTDGKPALLPGERDGFAVTHSDPATDLLLDDLRADEGMEWVPEQAWLTKVSIDSVAGAMTYDLAVDTTSARSPSRVAAGFELPNALAPSSSDSQAWQIWALLTALGAMLLVIISTRMRQMAP